MVIKIDEIVKSYKTRIDKIEKGIDKRISENKRFIAQQILREGKVKISLDSLRVDIKSFMCELEERYQKKNKEYQILIRPDVNNTNNYNIHISIFKKKNDTKI